jgi:CDP-paratose 2-epimerase
VVFRQSCVYGSHQYGNEDQGWVAHFLHSAVRGQALTIYGDGYQVRDLLDVRDLNHLYWLSLERIDDAAGQIFNVGGGPENARSVIEVLHAIEALLQTDAHYDHAGWRQGDQLFYVSDVSKAERVLGWRPEVAFEAGLEDLVSWVRADQAAGRRSSSRAVGPG